MSILKYDKTILLTHFLGQVS